MRTISFWEDPDTHTLSLVLENAGKEEARLECLGEEELEALTIGEILRCAEF